MEQKILQIQVVGGATLEENKQLKKENVLLKRKIEKLEVNRISEDVNILLQKWLDSPIPANQSLEQDVKFFAKSITRYIYRQLQ